MDSFCSLCLSQNLRFISLFQCNHYICNNCISGFLYISEFPKKCPICRKAVMLILLAPSPEATQRSFLFQTYGCEPKEAHLNPIKPSLKKIIILPDISNSPSRAAVIIRRIDLSILTKTILDIFYKCPLCDFADFSHLHLSAHMRRCHELKTCSICPTRNLPKFFTVYDNMELRKHKIGKHSSFSNEPREIVERFNNSLYEISRSNEELRLLW